MHSNSLNEVTSCEVCGNNNIDTYLNLGNHPMCDDLVKIDDARSCEEYPIEILFCEHCITAHQRFQIPKSKLFPLTYHYRSRHTADVLNGMRELVESCNQFAGTLVDKKVLDVGCNDGSLLSIFSEFGAKTYGIEPTDAVQDALQNGHIAIHKFLTEEVATDFVKIYGQPNIITFTNVFAHIEDLQGLIRSLKLLASPTTMIVIENHYLGSVLEKKQFDTFYHEHPRTYSYTSFSYIAKSLGMNVSHVDFPKRYGGNIRVYFTYSNLNDEFDHGVEIHSAEQLFGAELRYMSADIETWKVNKLKEIRAAVDKFGKLPAKAFPGRAAILIKILGLNEKFISAVYEKPGSGKIGHYVPGTRIPILSDAAFVRTDAPLVNFAWHISDEIRNYMNSIGYTGKIIDILTPSDFK
jgi:hypothetical protein